MANELVVVYDAGTEIDAYQLRNLLEEAGIEATVTDTGFESVTGAASAGWKGVAQVVVKEDDAEEARRIALEFDRRTSGPAKPPEPDSPEREAAAAAPGAWPQCPQCGARRPTRCPACGTAGTRFATADPDYAVPSVVARDARPISCSGCSEGGCSDMGAKAEAASGAETEEEPGEAEAGEPRPMMLVCPECDEPFVPEYARFCPKCGHEFAEGFDDSANAGRITPRAILLIVGVILLLVALFTWFAMVS